MRGTLGAALDTFYQLSWWATAGVCSFIAGVISWVLGLVGPYWADDLFWIWCLMLCVPGAIAVGVDRFIAAGRPPLPQAEKCSQHTPPEGHR